jgi:ribosomal protein L7/L12
MTDPIEFKMLAEYQKAIRTLLSVPSTLPSMDLIVAELAARDPAMFNIIVEFLNEQRSRTPSAGAERAMVGISKLDDIKRVKNYTGWGPKEAEEPVESRWPDFKPL